MKVVLGVDSGGSKTHFAVCDQHANIVAFHQTDSITPVMSYDWVGPFEALMGREADAVALCERAILGLPFFQEDAAYTASQIETAARLFGERAIVQNDVRVAFDGAFAGNAGALILAGTGSMAWASLNGPNDPHVRVGGWGHVVGDEGSAFWIGRQSLQLVSQMLDGREPEGPLAAKILNQIGADKATFCSWANNAANARKSIASVAVATSDLAAQGDAQAQNILLSAAEHLAEQLLCAWHQVAGSEPFVWTFAGGVFRSEYMLKLLQERLRSAPQAPRLPPIGGALLRAALNAGWAVDDRWISTLAASLDERLKI